MFFGKLRRLLSTFILDFFYTDLSFVPLCVSPINKSPFTRNYEKKPTSQKTSNQRLNNWRERERDRRQLIFVFEKNEKFEKISLLSMELMIDIVASALTFEHWASTQQQEPGHRLCRSQSTSSTTSESDSNTRIYRQNMPHLERPIVPHMRLIESLPNLSLYDAWWCLTMLFLQSQTIPADTYQFWRTKKKHALKTQLMILGMPILNVKFCEFFN